MTFDAPQQEPKYDIYFEGAIDSDRLVRVDCRYLSTAASVANHMWEARVANEIKSLTIVSRETADEARARLSG